MAIQRPSDFDDLKRGDSIAVDGVCLTLETFDPNQLTFTLGPETLKVTEWTRPRVLDRVVNLERSLRLNDRIHGHLVTGHVDSLGKVVARETFGDTLRLTIEIPENLRRFVWTKGSVAINGVSLTVNRTEGRSFQVGLIPETLKRTNLDGLEIGAGVNLEIDNMARGLIHFENLKGAGA